MIKLIIGNKGSGKTKKLVELVNSCVENSDGNVVCVEKSPKLTYDISSKARLLETETYSINGCKAFYGFLAGRDYSKLPQFFDMLSELSEATDVNFYFTISCDKEDLPVEIFDYCEEL